MRTHKQHYGYVKAFNPDKGYGFIVDETDRKEYFAHISQVDKNSYPIARGKQVIFEAFVSRGKTQAMNILVIEDRL